MMPRLALLVAAAMLVPFQQLSLREALERAYRASNRGVASLEQYEYGEAAAAFREALRIAPRLAAARFNLAVALLYAGRADEARVEAEAAAAAMPAAPQPPFVLGLIARAGNRAADAEAAFRRVLEIDPADPAANVNLGQLLLQKREYEPAVTAFRAAVAAEPYNATAAYGLATALTRAGSAAEGQQQMTRFQELRDSAYAVTYTQGYLQQGRYAEAITSTGAEPDLVDPAPPAVTFAEIAGAFTPAAASGVSAASLFDVDGDGDLDVLTTGQAGSRLFLNDAGRFSAGPPLPGADAPTIRAAFGDFDNDGRADILIVGAGGSRLLRQRADGIFEDVTQSAKLPPAFVPGAIAWVDVDHDGDLDLVSAAPLRLLRNDGNGSFTDRTAAGGLAAADAAPGTGAVTGAAAVVPTDYDNRRDVDLLILQGGTRPLLFRNLRDGTFRESGAAIGLPMQDNVVAVAASDVNKDGFIDFFFARSDGPGVFALSDGREKFVRRDAPAGTAGATRAQFFDYDNDGLVDLIARTPAGARLWRNTGAGWSDETSRAGFGMPGDALGDVVLGDVDRDGDTDIVASRQGTLQLWRNEGGNRRKSVTVTLAPRVSNRSAFGTRIEIRAGSLRQMLEWSSASPAVVPADLVFGLGARDTADVVRVLWPSGILQTEVAPAARPRIEELDRKPSSCPYLYTWNGERFEFISDFLGGGEMGDWMAPGLFNTPDPDEYVRIEGRQLVPHDGRYEVRVTNELEEAMFLDRVRLLVVDHPAGVEVYPNEGLKDTPRPPFRLHATRGARVPVRASDDHGHDVRGLIAERDRRWPDDFARAAVRGYAALHTLTLDLGEDADRAVLLLTGWTGYAWSSDNVAAEQAGLAMQPPVLEVRDRQGAWVVVDRNIGFPVGRPQTIVVDMAGKWLGPSREVRIATTMQIFWDQVLVDTSGGLLPREIHTLDPAAARLRWRGFSAETSPDGKEPFGADYTTVSAVSPWKTIPGAYTREGDVRALLTASDDMFVIARPGDEIALSFEAAAAPALRAGWQRTFLLFADGFSKEMNIRSATPDVLGPLPFHAMSRYPYGSAEKYPSDAAHRDYLERYNTRIVPRAVPSLDASAASGTGRRPR